MAEKMKTRISKWDVAAELHVETVEHESALSEKVDDPCMDLTEADSIKPILSMNVDVSEINQSSSQSGEERNNNILHSDDICGKTQYSEQFDLEGDCKDGFKKQEWECRRLPEADSIKPILSMNVDVSKINQSSSPSDEERNNNILHSDDTCEKTQYSEQFDLEGDCKDGFKKQEWECRRLTEADSTKPILSMNVDVSEINQSSSQSGEERNNNILHSDDICEKTQYSEQFDLEGDCNDGFKKREWEPASHDRNMAECVEKQGKPHRAAYDMSPGPEERHQRTRNMSPIDDRRRSLRKRSRSRSLSYDSRSRSKSPSFVSRHCSEKWTDKGRMRGMTPACRAFAAGNCIRGNECRFLHEGGGWEQIDRHHDAGLTDGRGSRIERERQLVSGIEESLTDTREKNNYTRERLFRRHEEHSEDGWGVPHHGYRSNERCFDFTQGRCHRGAFCRYIHHDESSDGGWNVKDESRGMFHDRRGGSASFSRRPVHQRFPCKYFLRGHCLHGEGCKYLHQVGPLNIPVERSLIRSQHSFVSGGPAGNIASANVSELQDQTTHYGATNPRGENVLRVSNIQPIDKQNLTNRSLSDSYPAQTQDAHKETQPSEQKTTTPKVREELSSNNPPTISVAGQNAENRGQSQFAPQLLHAQSTSSFQQFARPLPLKGQMQHIMHSHSQNGKNQFAARHKPPDDHSFNASMENLSANPSFYQLNPQNLDSRGQVQQNLIMSRTGNNFNLNKQIQQNGPLIHNEQNQPDFSGHSRHDIIGAGDSQQILPQNVQSQAQSVPAHVSNGQNHLVVVPQSSSNPQIFKSNEKNCESTTIGQAADSLEVAPSPFNSDNSITHKVVTIEQAAKITDLSASLAQFFGTAARNSQPSAGMTPQPFLNPSSIGSFVTTVAPSPTEANQQIHVIENIKQVDDSSSMELNKIEAHGINKEPLAPLQNGDPETRKDGDSKKIKEAKEIRMFKCALVEFVKDILKPKWKEGQLSKEAYKTIVKKAVDKVCGSLQGPNVPQTQDKIDLYLLNSKAKLSKLVQAYVEKFVNS